MTVWSPNRNMLCSKLFILLLLIYLLSSDKHQWSVCECKWVDPMNQSMFTLGEKKKKYCTFRWLRQNHIFVNCLFCFLLSWRAPHAILPWVSCVYWRVPVCKCGSIMLRSFWPIWLLTNETSQDVHQKAFQAPKRNRRLVHWWITLVFEKIQQRYLLNAMPFRWLHECSHSCLSSIP